MIQCTLLQKCLQHWQFHQRNWTKNHWVEFKAPEGKQGIPGKDGTNGRDGNDGTGLILKTFIKDQTYHHGDYVLLHQVKIQIMIQCTLLKKTFTALKVPYNELDKNHWMEFQAPRGETRRPGKDQGPNGNDGETEKMVLMGKLVVMDMMVKMVHEW